MESRYLYKAKRKDNGEWVEGFFAKAKWYMDEKEMAVIFPIDICLFPHCETSEWFEVDESTRCQCTGLTDKNGKLIWENDILMGNGNPKDLVKVSFGKFYVIDVETIAKVDEVYGWHTKVIPTDALSKCEPFCLDMPLTEFYINRCEYEVIGSRFDNPELLEGQV